MEDDTSISNNSNVVKGPWTRAKVISPQETDRLTDDMAFIDEVAEGIMIPTIHNLAENGVDIKGEEFISEIGFLNEIIKSIMYRTTGYQHPMTDLVASVMTVETENPLTTYAKFDHELVNKIVEKMFEESDEENDPT
tara:strand:- start:12 stop:422 length:411 start_codon:yes stop_codon:yes gene_type:complete